MHRDACEDKQKETLDMWTHKARQWKASSREACRFAKNPEPSKATVVESANGATVDPTKVQDNLFQYWRAIETWPANASMAQVCDNFEDRYSLSLPRCEFDIELTDVMLHKTAKIMNNSSGQGLA